jgi:4-hydroxy-3-polyprenylbenzoate decarboxylase
MIKQMNSYIVAITGASGSIYGIGLTAELLKSADSLLICISEQAFSIIKMETGIDWTGESEADVTEKIQKYYSSKNVRYLSDKNLAAPISSGSFRTGSMFVVPCSMKTLSGIANGYANNLIERSADVVLKEGRRLILAPREMPLNAIHLENMLRLARLGVTLAPPIPAFYHKPESIDDIVNFVVGKLLDIAGVEHNLVPRWKGLPDV